MPITEAKRTLQHRRASQVPREELPRLDVLRTLWPAARRLVQAGPEMPK